MLLYRQGVAQRLMRGSGAPGVCRRERQRVVCGVWGLLGWG